MIKSTVFKKLTVVKAAVIATALFSAFAPAARATAALELYDGASCAASDCITISDSGTVTVVHGSASASGVVTAAGFVSANVSVGSVFTINVDTGESKPLLAGGSMDLTDNNITSSGSGTLTILWSDIGFAVNPGTLQASGGGTLGGSSSIVFNTFASGTNTLFATSGTSTTETFSTTPFAGTANSATGVPAAPYSMTEELIVSATGAIHDSGDFTLNVVPEPASVALLGGILLLSAKAIRRKAKRA